MGLPLIGFPNRADGGTVSAGSWQSALPASNAQDADIGVVARSADATTASTRMDFDLGAAYQIRVIMVYLPNATLSATVRVYADDEATFTSPPYDPGAENLYPSTFFPASTTYFGEDVSSSAMTAEMYNEGLRYPYIHIASSAQNYRYWRIDINDTGNSDGYVDVGRVWISSVYRPATAWRQGGSLGYQEIAGSVRTQGGRKRAIKYAEWRTAQLVLPMVAEDEATIETLEVMRRIGSANQFAFIFDEDDTTHLQRRSYLATLGQVDLFTFPSALWMQAPFLIEEEL